MGPLLWLGSGAISAVALVIIRLTLPLLCSLGVYTHNEPLVFREFMGPLLDAVKMGDREAAREWSYLDPWSNLQEHIYHPFLLH